MSQLLRYTPSGRPTPLEALAHEFFDELRSPTCKMPSTGGPLPPLFDFTDHELSIESGLNEKLLPKGPQQQSSSTGNTPKDQQQQGSTSGETKEVCNAILIRMTSAYQAHSQGERRNPLSSKN